MERRNQEIQGFYHTLAHELKTPLTSAREFVSWELFTYAYLGLDDRESLLRVLSTAPKQGIIGRLLLAFDPSFDHLREDPRFREVLPGPESLV